MTRRRAASRAAVIAATMDPERREHFVYRAFDEADRLLYVGCTKNLDGRHADHKRYSDWYQFAARFHLAGPYTYNVARHLESYAIATDAPYFNVTLRWHRDRREVKAQLNEYRDRLRVAHPDWTDTRVLEVAVQQRDAEHPLLPPMRDYLAAVSA